MSYLEPALPLFLLLALAGLVRMWRKSAKGHRPWMITAGILGLVLLSLNPVAWVFSRPLEIGYEQNPTPSSAADAIVVLSGTVYPPKPDHPYRLAGPDTYARVQHAAWLFKHWAPLPVLACGGGPDTEAYSETMRRILESEGIPPSMIWIEERSKSTYENAVYGYEILRQHGISRIALVVDARSMTRAAAVFRKQGLAVVPAPFRFYNLDFSLEDILPTWRAIQANGETAHELVGLLWYWLRGWI
jgi:uncharacterized SAM-binding protein YcdF (DUF218 family)